MAGDKPERARAGAVPWRSLAGESRVYWTEVGSGTPVCSSNTGVGGSWAKLITGSEAT